MKVTINGKVNNDVLKAILEDQIKKTKTIDNFCKDNKLNSFIYQDSELEYEFTLKQVKKIEVRKDEQN